MHKKYILSEDLAFNQKGKKINIKTEEGNNQYEAVRE